jgi:hypothetical protein
MQPGLRLALAMLGVWMHCRCFGIAKNYRAKAQAHLLCVTQGLYAIAINRIHTGNVHHPSQW